MAVPKEILAVERPKGTIVRHSGNKYYVIKRTSKYDGGRRVPVDLGIVGEIVDGKFVLRVKTLDGITVDVKDYGNVTLCHVCGKTLLEDLMKHFSVSDANKIYAYALLKVIYGDITARDLSMHYDTSFVSELFPGVPCSRNTVGKFLDTLGRNINTLDGFMKTRLDALDPEAYMIVDGMLKSNNSETNSCSEFSRKGRIKNSQDVSILYAIDYENMEPLACSVYPGNMLDKTSFKDFTQRFDIKRGVIIGDKGIVLSDEQRKDIAEKAELKYLVPIKRNLKIINTLGLQEYDDILSNAESAVLCKKTEADGRYYYAFLNVYLQGSEAQGYVLRQKSKLSKKKTIENILDAYNSKKNSFGTIIFESNMDITCDEAYLMYSYRWSVEEIFDYYKNILEIGNVRVQDDTRLYGGEFINFIAAVITCRVKNYIEKQGLSEKYSYSQIMKYLSKIKKCRNVDAPLDWHPVAVLNYISQLAQDLNIDV